LACGKPVIAGQGGNYFLEEERLGSIVSSENVDEIFKAVLFWLFLPSVEKRAHSARARQFACTHLSVEKMLHKRFEFWNRKLCETGLIISELSDFS
jgi:glycosyltransferase involved in cell wall biosynthesis